LNDPYELALQFYFEVFNIHIALCIVAVDSNLNGVSRVVIVLVELESSDALGGFAF
jgi:hypothetical protein